MKNLDGLFEVLFNDRVHFDRKSYGDGPLEYVVWTSGYRTQECYDLEKLFRDYGFTALSMDFDKQCGKTRTHFKQQSK